jgi:hypothetical protein
MLGALQILSCCTPSTVPIYSDAFPGAGQMVVSASASVGFILDVSNFYKLGTANTPCDSYGVLLYDGTEGHAINSSISIATTSSALTAADQGSYAEGIRWKFYSGTVTVADKVLSSPSSSSTLLGSKELYTYSTTHYADIHCDDPIAFTIAPTRLYTEANQNWVNAVSFSWTGVAQRDLPGIRLKVLTSGGYTWLVKVVGGVVTVYSSDGTKTFSSSGTMNAVVNAINSGASGINTFIQARTSNWGTTLYGTGGETAGAIGVGLTEWHYVFTRNDPSTMLKDLEPTYINFICVDTFAPALWQTSTRLPVYERGDVLPPRGIVKMTTIKSTVIGFNTLYATYPALKLYDNTAEGALSFITDPIYVTPTKAWGADVYFNPINVQVTVDTSLRTFQDIWASYTGLSRYSLRPANFSKSVTYAYSPLTLSIFNETFFGTCNYCQNFSLSSPCYQETCPPEVCSSGCMVSSGCDFNACGVYCFVSSCYYIGDPTPFTPSCASDSGCIINYSYMTPGDTISTTPPASGQYTAEVALSSRFI